jgi:hypothetical protein
MLALGLPLMEMWFSLVREELRDSNQGLGNWDLLNPFLRKLILLIKPIKTLKLK